MLHIFTYALPETAIADIAGNSLSMFQGVKPLVLFIVGVLLAFLIVRLIMAWWISATMSKEKSSEIFKIYGLTYDEIREKQLAIKQKEARKELGI